MTLIPVTPELSRNEQRAKVLKSLRIPFIIVSLLGVMALVIFLAAPQRSSVRFAPDNPGPQGARALAQVLANNGVEITYQTSFDKIGAPESPESTLLISTDQQLPQENFSELLSRYNHVVLLNPEWELLDVVSEATRHYVDYASSYSDADSVAAQCTLPAAIAAQEIDSPGYGFVAIDESADDWQTEEEFDLDEGFDTPALPSGFEGCFPLDYGWHLIQATTPTGQQLTLLDDQSIFSNAIIEEHGHAALALHLLGQDDQLVWYVPTNEPADTEEETAPWPLPFKLGIAVAVVAAVFFSLWRGRRLGPIISEELPVVVKASESVRGRGKLYRAGKAHAHAASSLRAGTATRLGSRLGLPQSSPRTAFTAAVSAATGREQIYIDELFYGPAPTNDVDLTTLAQRLSDLESEIHA